MSNASTPTGDPHPPLAPAGDQEKLARIGETIRTQDNRITQDPIFVVQQKQRIWGPDQGDYVWKDDEWNDVDDAKAAELDDAYDLGEPTTGYTKAYYEDIWVFVTACFTEQGCKDYLRVNGHNLREPRIYAESGFRNAEWIFLRKFLAASPGTVQAPAVTREAVGRIERNAYHRLRKYLENGPSPEVNAENLAHPEVLRVAMAAGVQAPSAGRPMTWTREKPKRAGWYWHRSQSAIGVCSVYMAPFGFLVHFNGASRPTSVSEVGGFWAGPIPEPETSEANRLQPLPGG